MNVQSPAGRSSNQGNSRTCRRTIVIRAEALCEGRVLNVPLTTATEETPPRSLEEAERRHIENTLVSTRWVLEGPQGAASILGLNPSTLRSRMKRLGIQRPG